MPYVVLKDIKHIFLCMSDYIDTIYGLFFWFFHQGMTSKEYLKRRAKSDSFQSRKLKLQWEFL